MISFAKSYVCSDENVFATLELAQQHELSLLLNTVEASVPVIVRVLVAEKDKVIDILTTTQSSRPRARKSNGGRKIRKTQTTALATDADVTP